MAKNKALKAAQDAYNRNPNTKGGQKKAQQKKKKKEKTVGSSWESVKDKAQTAGSKGEENRKSSLKQTKTAVNKGLGGEQEKKERTKSGSITPVKPTTGAGNAHRGATSKNTVSKANERREGVKESQRAREVAGDVIQYAGKDLFATGAQFLKNAGKNKQVDPDYAASGKSLENAAKAKETGKYEPVKTAPKNAKVNTRTGTWETKTDVWKKVAPIADKAVKSAEKELEDATKNISDDKKYKVPELGVINKLIGTESTKKQKKTAKKEIETALSDAGLTVKDAVAGAQELSKWGADQGWDDDTMLTNGKTWGQTKKEAATDMIKQVYGARLNAYKGYGEIGKISKKDLTKMGIQGGVGMAEMLIPYIGTAGKYLKAADALSTGGKALTAVEGGSRVVTQAGKAAIKDAVKKGMANGNTLKGIEDAAKLVAKSDLKTNVKREILANALQDATIGTTIDYMSAQKQGLTGKDAWKYLGQGAVMNAALGAPIAGIAGRTGKAGKTAINEGIVDSANAVINLSKADGIELGTLLKRADDGSITPREQARLTELQDKAFGSEQYAVDAKGKIVQSNAETSIEALSKTEAKDYLNLKVRQAKGILKPEEYGRFLELQGKVQNAYKQTEKLSENIINLNSSAIKARDLSDAETAVKFYERTGNEAKLKVAQKALEAAKTATNNLNEALDRAVKIMTDKTGIEYKWVTADEMRALGANEDELVKGFTHFDENGKATVLINRDSPQAWQTVIGHETMHLIKKSNPQAYKELGDALEKYANELGEYDDLVAYMRRNYPELQGNDPAKMANFHEEVVSEMLGRYVFGEDDKFIKRLAGENPTALEKMVDYIKNLIKRTKNPELAEQFKKFVDSADEAIRTIDKDKVAEAAKKEADQYAEIADSNYVKDIGAETKWSKVTNEETLKFLDDQEKAGKTVEVYRAMAMIDGELYPPMATKLKGADGKASLQDANKLGEWVQADEHPELLDKNGKFVLRKDNGTSVPAAYNPYIHTSFSPLNDQFTSAFKRPNLVVVKGIVPESELTSGYKATGAKDAVGKTQWHSGVVAGQLPKAREVMLSRWFKPTEVMEDADVAKVVADTLKGTDIEIPYNVVTPSLRKELEKLGVPIGEGRGGAPKAIPKLEAGKFSKQKREGAPTVSHIVDDITGDSRFNGDAKQFAKDIDELATLIREKKDPLDKVNEILDKHIKIDEYEEYGEAIDPNVKEIIKSAPISLAELGNGTIAHKLENIGLSKDDVPSWVQLRSNRQGARNGKRFSSLDGTYAQLSDERPDLFPPDASSEDKLLNIINASKQEPSMARKPQEWIDGERADLGADLIDRVGEVIDAERKALEAKPKETPKAEKPKEKKPVKPKEPEKTEVQKVRENDFASDNVKTALDDIEKAGVYKEQAEKKAKRFNELDRQIAKETKHIENARKSEKYATEAERAERIAELEDNLQTLKNKQAKVAGEIEQMGKMKAVDEAKSAGEQIKELRGDVKINKELKNTENLTKTDNWIKDKWLSVRRLWEDSLIDVEKAAKESGDLKLRGQVLTAANRVRNSMSEANTWITKHRKSFDNKVGGKSLDEIFNKKLIENEPKYADFQEYLIMKHVPARHAKGTDIYPEISPALAEKRVKELEKQYGDEIKNWAQDVYDYINDLQKYRVDSGMLSKEAADQFAKDYPFYVPTNRVNDETIDFFSGGVSNGIRSAKGGDNDVLDIYSQLYTATNKTIHAAEENQMLNLYFKAKGVTEEQLKDATLEDLEHAVIEAKVNKKTGTASVSFFVDGKPVRLPCNHQLALGLREMDGLEFERLMKAAKVATLYGKPFKALVTDWNLVFGVRNGARDLQQALVNSKDTRYFGSSMGAAAHSIAHADAPYRKLYASMGGEQAQLVSYDAVAKQMGIEKQGKVDAIHEKVQEFVDLQAKGKHVNPIHYIEGINGAIEMMPRMCEFIGTLRKEADKMLKQNGSSLKQLRKEIVEECNALEKAGKIGQSEISAEVENRLAQRVIDMVGKDTIDTAMRNANDITLNFGRSGVLGKALNMGFVPYLNPSIQGLSKLVRLFTEAGQEGGWKALASIGMKLGTFTIAPAVFNELLLKDNEDYQNLNTRDKDNNFFIPLERFGEEWAGKFLKFPKPRENAVLAEPVEYALRYFLNDSEYAYFDWDKLKMEGVPLWEKIPLTDEGKQSFRTAIDNIGVINPMTSNMLSPLWQTFHNKTWYGGNIESAYESSINEETGKPNVPVNERYDVATSGISIALGQTKVAKELNLSPKKIDNILDSYTGMIYDLGISQTTEEAKTRGNWLFRTMASQFVKDSVFSNKLSTKAWDKMDGMKPQAQKDYKSTYMYDTFKYDDAMDEITADKNLTNKQKMDAKRDLMIQKNKLNREAINGDPNTSNPLVDIAKHLGATKTLNKFLPDTGGKDTDTWADFFKTYKNAKGYGSLTSEQKKVESQKFLDVYALGVKGQLKQDPTKFHDSPSWGMTGVAAAQLASQGKLNPKDANAIMKACGVYESQVDVYHNYAEHGGNVSRYAVTEKRVGKTLDRVGDWGMDKKSGLWQGGFSKTMGAKGGTIAMSLATDKKVQFKDRAYYIANSSDPQMMDKMNAARGFSQKYGHKTKEISQLAIQADALGDGNTYLKNDEIIMACNEMKGNNEEKSMAYILLGGNPKKNPFGAIGNYSIDGDTGIQPLEEESSGKGGRGRGRRRRGGGGSGGNKGKMPKTESGAIKGKVSNVFATSNGSKSSNLNDSYRKKVHKLRKQLNK